MTQYSDCPGCSHDRGSHDIVAGCNVMLSENQDDMCICILRPLDIHLLWEYWGKHPRVIND